MADEPRAFRWLDLLWLIFLSGLALLPPIAELHKQEILLAIGVFQLLESRFIRLVPGRGEGYAVAVKIALATSLINHTHDVAINSSYWPIYFLPVMTAAMYFGAMGTLTWILITSVAYSAYLIPAGEEFEISGRGLAELALRILFFFVVGMVVNRFVLESRTQSRRYQLLASDLSEANQSLSLANQSLKRAQADARRAERLAALGQLSAGLAHEIRNPLGVIKGSAEILTQKLSSSDAMAKELSSYIYTEVNRVSALVSRFLDFARPLRLTLHAAELPPVVERALKSVADQGALTPVEVKRDFASGLPKVMMDEELCDQVFTNVLLNACQAMGEAGGTLRVAIHADNGDEHNHSERSVIVDIEDSGPGVDADLREQIFNPFVTTKKTGVGLGLAIVSKIMDAHGGSIKLISNSGPGACFRLTFVAAENAPAAEAAHANAATQ